MQSGEKTPRSGFRAFWCRASAERRILVLCGAVFLLDQVTKTWVVAWLPLGAQREVVDGFFRLVHWGNTGSAWSLFRDHNHWLALVALVAVIVLWWMRRHFEAHRAGGQVAMGLLLGGILGNFVDRLLPSRQHVVDFLYFYVQPHGGGAEIGFPAFNVADMAICAGVGLMTWLLWNLPPETHEPRVASPVNEVGSSAEMGRESVPGPDPGGGPGPVSRR